MKTLSTTIEYNGSVVKVEGGKVYARAFGTTIQNHSMHWSWLHIPIDKLKDDLVKLLKQKGLL